MINLIWTKINHFSKVSTLCAQYFPSKQNTEEGGATNLDMIKIFTLSGGPEMKCQITSRLTFPIFPVCFPKSSEVRASEGLSLSRAIQLSRLTQPPPSPRTSVTNTSPCQQGIDQLAVNTQGQ